MRVFGFFFIFLSFQSYAIDCPEQFQDFLKKSFHSVSHQDPSIELVKKIKANTLKESAHHNIPFQKYMSDIDEISKRDPEFKKIVKLFENRAYTFAVDQSTDQRLAILKKGILNQHETLSSAGVLAPEKRNFVESQYLRMKLDDYEKLAPDLKPKSMYLVPDLKSEIQFAPTHYIENPLSGKLTGDTWILKLEEIEDHTLFIAGDTLDRALLEGDLVDDFKQMDINYSAKLDGTHAVDYLLPLEWLKTTAPFYYEQVKTSNKLRYVDPKTFKDFYQAQVKANGMMPQWQEMMTNTSRPNFDEKFYNKFSELKKYDETLLVRPYGNYSEGLYFGKLDPNKIKALIYHEKPPTREEQKILKSMGIEVIDGRH